MGGAMLMTGKMSWSQSNTGVKVVTGGNVKVTEIKTVSKVVQWEVKDRRVAFISIVTFNSFIYLQLNETYSTIL